MQSTALQKIPHKLSACQHFDAVKRITALWALSEAALGGFLHAFRIPFTGLFIGGSAVIFITLIYFLSEKRGTILKAMLMVMIIKAIASPQAPVSAYVAIAFQGISGEFLFHYIKRGEVAALLLGFFSLLQSAFQKIVSVTLVFGQTFWESIDLFAEYVIQEFLSVSSNSSVINISDLLILTYILMHIAAGILIGIWAYHLARFARSNQQYSQKVFVMPVGQDRTKSIKKPVRRRLWKKISTLIIVIIFTSLIIWSYLSPVSDGSKGYAVIIMLIRSILIMAVWYFTLGPFIIKILRRYFDQKKRRYHQDIEAMMTVLPILQCLIERSWQLSTRYKFIKRIYYFIQILIVCVLYYEFDPEQL